MKEAIVEIGWFADGSKYPYVIPYTENEDEIQRIHKLILDADVVIIGSAPDSYIIPRLKRGKLTFKYAERFYRYGLNIKTFPRAVIGTWLHHGRFQKYPLYMLCSSAYTPYDCARFGNYKNRMYKWGYFPETKHYELDKLFERKKKNCIPTILWVGRLLTWKHPDDVIQIAAKLKQEGYRFQMNLIGYGELEEKLQTMITNLCVSDCACLLGKKTPEEVRMCMENANIFLFTSDYNEGWGAVLNEAMNSGCAVVVSHAVGAAPFLVLHGQNGLIYRSGDLDSLYAVTRTLLDNPGQRDAMGMAAYHTIHDLWCAEKAVQRFVKLVGELMKNKTVSPDLFLDGPCSIAPVIHQNIMYDFLIRN